MTDGMHWLMRTAYGCALGVAEAKSHTPGEAAEFLFGDGTNLRPGESMMLLNAEQIELLRPVLFRHVCGQRPEAGSQPCIPRAASDGPADLRGTWATREGHQAAVRARGVLESARQASPNRTGDLR